MTQIKMGSDAGWVDPITSIRVPYQLMYGRRGRGVGASFTTIEDMVFG